ncbi:MAG: hypothetical protein IPO08_16545 [Xanthomonadales bacterium]|nr:hypothetical protein [Xanthomonadales bacterium]
MPRGDSRQAIVDSAMQGIYKAAEEWEKMSGLWLEAAPEYFATTRIAQGLAGQLKSAYICLEWNIRETLEDARQKPKRGRPPVAMNGGKRFDVVVYYGQTGRPRAAIEVKHRFASCSATLSKDFRRLAMATADVQAGSSLSLGCLVVYLEQGPVSRKDATPADRIRRKQESIRRWADERLADTPGVAESVKLRVHFGEVESDTDDAFSGAYACVIIALESIRKRNGP